MKKTILKLVMMFYIIVGISISSYGQNNVSTLKFDGSDDDVSYSTDVLNDASDFTIEAWVKIPSSATSNASIVQRVHCYYLYYRAADNQLSFSIYRNTSNNDQYIYHSDNDALPNDDEWHHVAVIRKASPSSLDLYVDGVEVSSSSWNGIDLLDDSGKNLYIGSSGSSWYFEGKIDEVHLRNEAVVSGDLHSDKNDDEYTAGASTEALFHFNENTGATTANDAGGSATINGATWATFDDLWFPIQLASFDASIKNKKVELKWITLSETNNKGFEIQRSIDAKNWEVLGFVEGKGDSRDEVNYTFVDNSPKSNNFYRLSQIDFDGKITYSNVISVSLNTESKVSVFPNPTKSYLNIAGLNTNTDFVMYDKLGKIVKSGTTSSEIDISSLNDGVYYLKIDNLTHKIIKK